MLCRVPYKALGKEPDMGDPLMDSLPSAGRKTLDKGNSFAECHLGHSAKTLSPSAQRRDDGFSLPSTSWHSAKSLPSAREKVLDKEGFADEMCVEPSLPSATLGKAFAECFRHSAKLSIPVVNAIYNLSSCSNMIYYCWFTLMHVKVTLFNWNMKRPHEKTVLPQGWNETPLAI
jgi:hypothetical protein